MIGKSRKLAVPLIAIMVSAVALAGVVYAATTTVQNDGKGDSDYFVIDMYDSTHALATTELTASDFVTIYTTKNISTPTNNRILFEPTADAKLGYVAVFTNSETPSAPAGGTPTLVATISSQGGGWTVSNNVFTKSFTGTVTATVTITVAIGNIDSGYYPITILAEIDNAATFTGGSQAAAATIADAIDGLHIQLVVSASDVAA